MRLRDIASAEKIEEFWKTSRGSEFDAAAFRLRERQKKTART